MTENIQTFPNLFHSLLQALGQDNADLDSEGNCTIVFGQKLDVTIHFNEVAQSVTVFTEIADISDLQNRENLLERMLKADFFWMATKGFTLTLDKESWRVILMGREHAGYFTDIETLARYLGTCAEVAWDWQELVKLADVPDIPTIWPRNAANEEEEVASSGDANPFGPDFLLNQFIIP